MSLIKWRKNGETMPSFPSFNGWVDNFFRDDDDFVRAWRNRWNGGEMTVPAVNVSETKDAVYLEVGVPGMKKKDFKLSIENGMLIISAETKAEKEDKGKDYTRKEFNYRSFRRSFWLPENVDSEAIKANYKEGILKISLPKIEVKEKETAKVIKIA